jgi:biotin transport system permease protein
MIRNRERPWAYRNGHSPIHRMRAGIKLLFLLFLSLAVFFPNKIFLPATALLLLAGSLLAGIKPWELLRGSGPLFTVVLAAILLPAIRFSPPGFDGPKLREGCVFGIRMGLSFSAGAFLFSVTTMGEIKKSIAKAEGVLHLEKLRFSLGLSLLLGFMPRFFEVWEAAELAWESRAGGKGPRRLMFLIPLVLEGLLEKAAETAAALESRGTL